MHKKQFIWVVFILGILFSCGKKEKENLAASNASELQKYHEYISDVSSGRISIHDEVFVVLQNPVAGWSDQEELPSDLLQVSPSVKGKVIAINNRTIAFRPDEHFDQETVYTFTLNLEQLIPEIQDEFEEFIFGVETIKQQFSIVTQNLQSYSKEWQYLKGTLSASDQISLEVAQQLIKAQQGKKALNIKFETQADFARRFEFTIDSIQRQEEDSEVEVSWSGKAFDIESEGKESFRVPGKNNFSILEVSIGNTEQQYININFTDPIKKKQNFDGLVTISSAKQLKYTVEGNNLKVYPRGELKGTLEVTVFAGIKSVDDYKLKETYTEKVSFQQIKPEVRLLQSGVILPNSDNLKFNFEAVNLKAVEVVVMKIYQNNVLQFLQTNNLNGGSNIRAVARPIARKLVKLQDNPSLNLNKWNAFAIDLKELITPDPGAIYRIELNYNKAYSLYKCEGDESEETEASLEALEENFNDEAPESSYWDSSQSYYEEDYYYDWDQRDNPCDRTYYNDKKVTANILASNLGIVVKKGLNHSYSFAVTDILTTQPKTGVTVKLYNYQQQEIGSGKTDAEGLTMIDADRPAFFAIASLGKEQTYVKLSDGNALSLSKFDIAGTKLQKGIKGFIYGERGVWRPGDTLFLSFLLNDNANKLPAKHPVKFELRDPYGKIIHQETTTESTQNFYRFTVAIDDEAPTGNWQAKVLVGGASFSKNLKIETIKPNRLKIKTDFDTEILSAEEVISGDLEVKWLHGAIARNLKADINVRFRPMKTNFKKFPSYTFDDPARIFGTEEQVVFEGKISNEGLANFRLSPELSNQASGKLKASFITKVYENGGDFSTDVVSKEYSPYTTYIGLNTPKGDKARGMLLTDTDHKFEVVTVDASGNPVATKDLKVRIYKIHWRWWWETSEDNLSSYSNGSYRDEVYRTELSTNAQGKGTFTFNLKYPEWGRYLVRIEDPNGGHATGKTLYIDWPGWAGKSRKNDPSAATMLMFSTDKKTYNVGEKAIVTFPSSNGGRALVSVENGTEVLHTQWVMTQQGETKFELPIEALYTPNVYLHITLIQPHALTANDLPIRMYGVTPIMVENPDTRLVPKIQMPEVLRPEETVEIMVSEQQGKSMTYSLAIVDEGLLDLTRFKTPNPWNTFYAREALGVKTWDMYDDIIGAFGGSIEQIFSIGGDGEAAGSKSKKANRFKPMVIYEGPFTLNQGERENIKLKYLSILVLYER